MTIHKDANRVRSRDVAANGALAIADNDRIIILLNSSDAATKTATFVLGAQSLIATADPTGGPQHTIILKARSSTGNYTIPASQSGVAGNVLLDAANEGVDLVRRGATLHVVNLLNGATWS